MPRVLWRSASSLPYDQIVCVDAVRLWVGRARVSLHQLAAWRCGPGAPFWDRGRPASRSSSW
eukprot:6624733-Alexandrium_andersonii.AAC.1